MNSANVLGSFKRLQRSKWRDFVGLHFNVTTYYNECKSSDAFLILLFYKFIYICMTKNETYVLIITQIEMNTVHL